MHALSDGGFTHALTLQLSRTSAQSGVQIMKSLPGLSADMESRGRLVCFVQRSDPWCCLDGSASEISGKLYPGQQHPSSLYPRTLWPLGTSSQRQANTLVSRHRFMVAYGRGVHHVCVVAILAGLLYSIRLTHGAFGRQLP